MATDQLLHFVVRNVTYTLTPAGFTITCYTNYPCHLYLRWTNVVPQKHINPIIRRGAQVGSYIDQCFVVYTDQEQNELGDTFTHTFTVEPWPFCETRWFYFWGTVNGQLSPSTSPIFEKHRIMPPTTIYRCWPLGPPGVTGAGAPTWAQATNATTGWHGWGWYVSQTGWSWWTSPNIWRSYIRFNLASIPPGKTIVAATLTARFASWKFANGGQAWTPSYHILLSYPTYNMFPLPEIYYQLGQLSQIIIEWWYPTGASHDAIENIVLPAHTLTTMQGKPAFAIAELSGHDHYFIDPGYHHTFGCNTYVWYSGYQAYVDVQVAT